MMALSRPLPALFGVLTALVMTTAACTASAPAPDHTPTPSPPSRLEQALERVPVTHTNRWVKFADAQGAAASSGDSDFQGMSTIEEDGLEAIPRHFAGLPIYSTPYGLELFYRTGVDILGFDFQIWAGENIPSFLAMRGGFDAGRLTGELSAVGYVEEAHGGTTYLRSSGEEPEPGDDLRQILAATSFNVVAPENNWLLVTSSSEAMTDLIDTQDEGDASLLSSAPHRAIAETVGQELLGATFWPGAYSTGPSGFPNLRMEPAQQDEMTASWRSMQPHELTLMGYRVVDEQEEVLVAMFYPDPEAAVGNAGEIETRWRSVAAADLDPFGDEGADLCAELTTQAVTVEGGSVLVASCPVTREQAPLGVGQIWSMALDEKLMIILVPDPQDIGHSPVE